MLQSIANFSNSPLGTNLALLDGSRKTVRNAESNLGDFMCDAILDYVANSTGIMEQFAGVPLVCLVNAGGIR